MSGTIIAVVMGLPTLVVIAWIMWLVFAALMAKWYGLEGLKAVPKIGAGFRPSEWATLGRRPQLDARRSEGNDLGGSEGRRPARGSTN